MCNPRFYGSGKRPMERVDISDIATMPSNGNTSQSCQDVIAMLLARTTCCSCVPTLITVSSRQIHHKLSVMRTTIHDNTLYVPTGQKEFSDYKASIRLITVFNKIFYCHYICMFYSVYIYYLHQPDSGHDNRMKYYTCENPDNVNICLCNFWS